MAKFPALPLWTDAFTAKTHHLTHCECGLYIRLLLLMWQTPNCRVPNDEAWLARHLRMTVAEVAYDLKPLIEEFCQTDGNWVTQKRLIAEYNYVTVSQNKRSVSAKRRWKKEKDLYRADAPTPIPTPTPIPISKKEKKEDIYSADFERFWAAYPRHIAKPAAAKAFAKAIAKTTVDEMLAAIAAQAETWRDPQFIPHPTTWLNQERWTDEKTLFNGGNGNGRPETLAERTQRLYDRAVELEAAEAARRTGEPVGSDSFSGPVDSELSKRR